MKLLVKFVAIFLLLSMIISLSSCSSGSNSIASEPESDINEDSARIKEADEDAILYKINTRVYSYDEVSEYIDKCSTFSDFCNHFDVIFYKNVTFSSSYLKEMNSMYATPWRYTVINTDKCPLLLIFFDYVETYESGETRSIKFIKEIDVSFSKDSAEKMIKTIRLLETIESDVLKLDPDGCYFINEHEYLGPEMFHESFHFFENGNAYIIVYRDSHNEVEDVVRFTM